MNSSKVLGLSLACAALAACGGGGGGGGGNATGATNPTEPVPTMSFTSSSNSIEPGQSITLSWQSNNADSCVASGGWAGNKAVSGTETINSLQQSQSFSLSCSGAGGGALRELSVVVEQNAGVQISFSSDAQTVSLNDQAQLSWTVTNADSCEASGAWQGDQALSGVFTTPPLTETASFRLTCFAQGDSAVALLSITVVDPVVRWQAPTENVDGSALTDLTGFNVYWGTSSRNYAGSTNVAAQAREWDLSSLGPGTYYVALTALNSQAEESGYSNEIRKVIL